jgi:two-component system response regulator GlrR
MQRILIVDDDTRIVDRLATLLAPRYETVTASTGFDALARIDEGRVDAILLDLKMPGLDGPGLVQELQKRDVAVPIILVSANPDLPARARALGIPRWLAKPFAYDELEILLDGLA